MPRGRHRRPSMAAQTVRTVNTTATTGVVAGGILLASPHLTTPVQHTAVVREVFTETAKITHPTYTVRDGDYLSLIAQEQCGAGEDWTGIYDANKRTIGDNPNLIYAGQQLTIDCRTGALAPIPVPMVTSDENRGVEPSGGMGSAPVSGSAYQNYLTIARFLVNHGYSKTAAAGIAACVAGESAGNPESVGSGGGGLIGFTPLPSGYVTGNANQDMFTQLNAILSYNQQWSGYLGLLNGSSDPVAAADIYSMYFERPAVTYSDVVVSVATWVYAQL
jgi:hypothetical protein